MSGDATKNMQGFKEVQRPVVLTDNLMELTTANMTCCLRFAVNTTLNKMCPENHSIPAWPTEAVKRENKQTNKNLTHYSSSESLGISVSPYTTWMNAPGKTLSPYLFVGLQLNPDLSGTTHLSTSTISRFIFNSNRATLLGVCIDFFCV